MILVTDLANSIQEAMRIPRLVLDLDREVPR